MNRTDGLQALGRLRKWVEAEEFRGPPAGAVVTTWVIVDFSEREDFLHFTARKREEMPKGVVGGGRET